MTRSDFVFLSVIAGGTALICVGTTRLIGWEVSAIVVGLVILFVAREARDYG